MKLNSLLLLFLLPSWLVTLCTSCSSSNEQNQDYSEICLEYISDMKEISSNPKYSELLTTSNQIQSIISDFSRYNYNSPKAIFEIADAEKFVLSYIQDLPDPYSLDISKRFQDRLLWCYVTNFPTLLIGKFGVDYISANAVISSLLPKDIQASSLIKSPKIFIYEYEKYSIIISFYPMNNIVGVTCSFCPTNDIDSCISTFEPFIAKIK